MGPTSRSCGFTSRIHYCLVEYVCGKDIKGSISWPQSTNSFIVHTWYAQERIFVIIVSIELKITHSDCNIIIKCLGEWGREELSEVWSLLHKFDLCVRCIGWMTSREVYAWGVINCIRTNTKYHMKLSGSLNKVSCNTGDRGHVLWDPRLDHVDSPLESIIAWWGYAYGKDIKGNISWLQSTNSFIVHTWYAQERTFVIIVSMNLRLLIATGIS